MNFLGYTTLGTANHANITNEIVSFLAEISRVLFHALFWPENAYFSFKKCNFVIPQTVS